MKSGKTPKIIFNSEGHSYIERSGKPCVSVTNVVGMFHESFDKDYNLTRSALKEVIGEEKYKEYKKERGYNVYPHLIKPPQEFFYYLYDKVDPKKFFKAKDSFKEKWALSSTEGTSFHEDREKELIDSGVTVSELDNEIYTVIENKDTEYSNCTLVDDLSTLGNGCYPELLVYLELDNVVVTGQVDKAFITKGRDYSSIDYKTNKKIGYMSSSFKFFPPFEYLPASKLMKYTMQQTLYSNIMENWGFNPEKQAIIHYKDYDVDQSKLIELQYMKKEAEEMLKIVDKSYS